MAWSVERHTHESFLSSANDSVASNLSGMSFEDWRKSKVRNVPLLQSRQSNLSGLEIAFLMRLKLALEVSNSFSIPRFGPLILLVLPNINISSCSGRVLQRHGAL